MSQQPYIEEFGGSYPPAHMTWAPRWFDGHQVVAVEPFLHEVGPYTDSITLALPIMWTDSLTAHRNLEWTPKALREEAHRLREIR